MNPKMVERTPHPGPLPIGSADSADAERENRSQRLDVGMRRIANPAVKTAGYYRPSLCDLEKPHYDIESLLWLAFFRCELYF